MSIRPFAHPFARQILLALSILAAFAAAPVEARRGGSFGSRGTRTYVAPRSTNVSPGYVAPISRSMTSPSVTPSSQYRPSYQPNSYPQRQGGLFGGFGGGMLTGLVAGGLIGHFFGHGYGYGGGGAGGGLLAVLVQLALIGGAIWLLMRLFGARSSRGPSYNAYAAEPPFAANATAAPGYAPAPPQTDLTLSSSDQDAFERLLGELQDAFAHEDYGRLRQITTPEVMGYLAEELSDNATHGRRNEVSGTRLLDGDISEAWEENGQDYATVAMRYESVDVMRDRTSGAVLSGQSIQPTVTTELWTFVRRSGDGSGWKVSAIQEA